MTGLLRCFTNVVKAGVAVAATPATVLADLATLPSTGYAGQPPFGRTGKLFKMAGRCMDEAVRPEVSQKEKA